jgi:hypothetical protein
VERVRPWDVAVALLGVATALAAFLGGGALRSAAVTVLLLVAALVFAGVAVAIAWRGRR